jgi:preprotein translocase subunit SecE
MSEKAEKKARIPEFFKGVKAEFKKITWPDKTSLFKQTVAVIGVSLVVGVLIAGLDSIIQFLMSFVLAL